MERARRWNPGPDGGGGHGSGHSTRTTPPDGIGVDRPRGGPAAGATRSKYYRGCSLGVRRGRLRVAKSTTNPIGSPQ